jgi:hydroxymethylpyrimidine pyrophosphatase-like HAD family hydrolase
MGGISLGAIFSDYDGTIANARVGRACSRVPLRIARVLERIARSVPLAIITSKDYDFVYPRTRFAHAWACLAGLQIVLKTGERELLERLEDKSDALRELAPFARRFEVEVKRIDGMVAGICIDWSRTKPPSNEERKMIGSILKRHGMYVMEPEGAKYIDAYGARPDKGRALERLKKLMGIGGSVLYMGDSELDNAAFEEADVSLGVCHGQNASALRADFLVQYRDLHRFLEELLIRGFLLDTSSQYLRRGSKC